MRDRCFRMDDGSILVISDSQIHSIRYNEGSIYLGIKGDSVVVWKASHEIVGSPEVIERLLEPWTDQMEELAVSES